MKIRTEFVTNSSSSSFVAIQLKGRLIAQIFEKHRDAVEAFFSPENDFFGGSFTIEDDVVNIEQGEPDGTIGEHVPSARDQIIPTLAGILTFDRAQSEDELEDSDCGDGIAAFLTELFRNSDEILQTLEAVSWTGSDGFWGEFEGPNVDREFTYSPEAGEAFNITESEQEDFDMEGEEFL